MNDFFNKFEYIKELFTKDFFIGLKSFILDEDFNSFYTRRLKEKRNYNTFDSALWLPNKEYMDNSNIYPIDFNLFLKMYNNVGSCAYLIDQRLLDIKFLIKELFSKQDTNYLSNNEISIKLNKNIIYTYYEKQFENDLYNAKIRDFSKLNIFDNRYLLINLDNSIDFFARNVLLSIFDAVQTYLEIILEKLLADNRALLQSYNLEARTILLSKENRTKDENKFITTIRAECKKIRNERLEREQGRIRRIFNNEFPCNVQELDKKIADLKSLYSPYKNDIQKLLTFDTSKENIKSRILKYIDENELNEIFDTELGEVLMRYVELKQDNYMTTFTDAVKYTLLDLTGNLGLIEHDENSLQTIDDTIKSIIKRHKRDNIPFKLENKTCKLLLCNKYLKLKQEFFN